MIELIREDTQPTQRHAFDQPTIRIGRVAGNDLVLAVQHISSQHVTIHLSDGIYQARDLGSTNGSLVVRQGRKLLLGPPKGAEQIALADGDLLFLGDIEQPVRLRVRITEVDRPAVAHPTIVAIRTREQTLAEVSQRATDDHRALRALFELAAAIADGERADGSARVLLQRVAEAALQALPSAVAALVALGDRQADDLELVAEAHRGPSRSAGIHRGISELVLRRGQAVLFGDEGQTAAAPLPVTLASAGVGSGIACPLYSGREVRGVLQLNCAAGPSAGLGETDLDLAALLAHHAGQALERAELVTRLRAAEVRLREENAVLRRQAQPAAEIIAESEPMRRALEELRQAAASDAPVLIVGETGTGKELAARFVHQQSRRRDGLLVPINCGALNETLLDSELFGHKKGAFTGALSDRKGVFEVAAGGTVFLDEIGEMPVELQARLLRVLEEGKIKRVGETLERPVDVRVVAATNRDLARMVDEERFRRDLYYRLRVFPVRLPPLRERPADVEPITRAYLGRRAQELGKRLGPIETSLLQALLGHRFPGNIRELINELERVAVRADEDEPLTAELLSEELLGATALRTLSGAQNSDASPGAALRERLDAFERELIAECLQRHGGHKTAAAAELGLTRQGLSKKMARLGL